MQNNRNFKKEIYEFFEKIDLIGRISEEEGRDFCRKLKGTPIKSIIQDEELMKTVHAFFENNLNISATSKSAFMHRNTLIYRLEKIRKETGFNIKNFNDARLFSEILMIREKIYGKDGR